MCSSGPLFSEMPDPSAFPNIACRFAYSLHVGREVISAND